MRNLRVKAICVVLITLMFSSCEVIWRNVVDKTATFSYFAEKFGNGSRVVYPRTCYKMELSSFKRSYKGLVSKPKKIEALTKVKYERNRLFISTIDSYRPQAFLASNITFTLVDSKGSLIESQSFMYSTERFNRDGNGWQEKFYRYHYLFILEETLSRKNMEKDRWPIFLTIRFPDGKYIKYKFY